MGGGGVGRGEDEYLDFNEDLDFRLDEVIRPWFYIFPHERVGEGGIERDGEEEGER